MSYSFFMSIFNIPIFNLQLVKQTRTDETPHLYICSSSSDPRDQCFAAGSWGDWTTNVGSVLGLHPMGMCAAQTLMEWALQDWDAQQFFCT